mgnify:FL=1
MTSFSHAKRQVTLHPAQIWMSRCEYRTRILEQRYNFLRKVCTFPSFSCRAMGDFLIELTIWQVKAWIALRNGAACIEIQKHEISDGQRISPPQKITVEEKGKKKSVNDRSDWRKI